MKVNYLSNQMPICTNAQIWIKYFLQFQLLAHPKSTQESAYGPLYFKIATLISMASPLGPGVTSDADATAQVNSYLLALSQAVHR